MLEVPQGRVVPYTIVETDKGTFDLFQNALLVGNFPTRETAEDAQKLAAERHK